MFLVGDLLELDERPQSVPAYPQGVEDRHRLRHGLAQLLDRAQLHVDGREIERYDCDLIGQPALHDTPASPQESRVRRSQVPEVAQQLSLLPGGPQLDERVLELLVKLACLEIELQRLLGLIEVDVAPNEVVTGGEEQMRILLMIDERDGAVEEVYGALRLAGI